MATQTKNTPKINDMLRAKLAGIKIAATKAYETNLTNGNYTRAAQIAKDFELGKENVEGTQKLAYLARLIRA